MTNQSSITQRAAAAIENTPFDVDSCYNYMIENDGSHFKTPKMAIIEAFENKFNLSFSDDPNKLIQFAGESFSTTVGKPLKVAKAQIKGWIIEGKVLKRESAIQLCFALNMSVEIAGEFLRRVGQHALNVRDAQEAIWLYCLTNGRSYQDAVNLLEKYSNVEPAPIMKDKDIISEPHGDTTKNFVAKITAVGNWDTDEQFMETFLIPNKLKFTAISNTAYSRYYHEKRLLQIKCISRALKEEQTLISTHEAIKVGKSKEVDYDNNDLRIYNYIILEKPKVSGKSKGSSQFSDVLRILANAYPEEYQCFFDGYMSQKEHSKFWEELSSKLVEDIENDLFKFRKDAIDDFLNNIMGYDNFIKEILGDIPYKQWVEKKCADVPASERKFDYSKSQYESFFSNFLRQEYFTKIESAKESSSTMTVRKMIVYMFFLNYIFDGEFSGSDAEWGYDDFYEKLSDILKECQQSAIYPADQFDFLILKAICRFQDAYYDTDWYDALDLFYAVIEKSFQETEDAEEIE